MYDRLIRAILLACNRVGLLRFWRIRAGQGKGLWISLERASANYWAGTNELPVQEALAQVLAPGQVFLDIGSNVGFFALIAARLVGPEGQVFAVEPVPKNAELISANAARNGFGNLKAIQSAAAAESGQQMLYLARHPGGATLSSAPPPPDVVGTLQVDTASVDDMIERGWIQVPDLVKIDVEGAELEVLHGMTGLLSAHGPRLLFEVDAADTATLESRYDEICDWLRSYGYETRRLDPAYDSGGWAVWHGLSHLVPGSGSDAWHPEQKV